MITSNYDKIFTALDALVDAKFKTSSIAYFDSLYSMGTVKAQESVQQLGNSAAEVDYSVKAMVDFSTNLKLQVNTQASLIDSTIDSYITKVIKPLIESSALTAKLVLDDFNISMVADNYTIKTNGKLAEAIYSTYEVELNNSSTPSHEDFYLPGEVFDITMSSVGTNSGEIDLEWSADPSATSYKVYCEIYAPNSDSIEIVEQAGLTYTISGLNENYNYYIKIVSYNAGEIVNNSLIKTQISK